MPEEFKNAIITGHFGFGFEENSVKSGRFKLLLFEERFRKAPFSGRIRVDVSLTVEIELRFQFSPASCGRCLTV